MVCTAWMLCFPLFLIRGSSSEDSLFLHLFLFLNNKRILLEKRNAKFTNPSCNAFSAFIHVSSSIGLVILQAEVMRFFCISIDNGIPLTVSEVMAFHARFVAHGTGHRIRHISIPVGGNCYFLFLQPSPHHRSR